MRAAFEHTDDDLIVLLDADGQDGFDKRPTSQFCNRTNVAINGVSGTVFDSEFKLMRRALADEPDPMANSTATSPCSRPEEASTSPKSTCATAAGPTARRESGEAASREAYSTPSRPRSSPATTVGPSI